MQTNHQAAAAAAEVTQEDQERLKQIVLGKFGAVYDGLAAEFKSTLEHINVLIAAKEKEEWQPKDLQESVQEALRKHQEHKDKVWAQMQKIVEKKFNQAEAKHSIVVGFLSVANSDKFVAWLVSKGHNASLGDSRESYVDGANIYKDDSAQKIFDSLSNKYFEFEAAIQIEKERRISGEKKSETARAMLVSHLLAFEEAAVDICEKEISISQALWPQLQMLLQEAVIKDQNRPEGDPFERHGIWHRAVNQVLHDLSEACKKITSHYEYPHGISMSDSLHKSFMDAIKSMKMDVPSLPEKTTSE